MGGTGIGFELPQVLFTKMLVSKLIKFVQQQYRWNIAKVVVNQSTKMLTIILIYEKTVWTVMIANIIKTNNKLSP